MTKRDTRPLESAEEAYFAKRVREAGGRSYKFGQNGLPDRIVLFPGGVVIFVEMKRQGERPRPLQDKQQRVLHEMGAYVVPFIDSHAGTNEFIRYVKAGKLKTYLERFWKNETV